MRKWRRSATRGAGLQAAILPAVFFVLAGTDGARTALRAAIWTGVAVVGLYAFVANRVSGLTVARSVATGGAFAVLGALLVREVGRLPLTARLG